MKDQGLFSYMLSNMLCRLVGAAFAAIPAQLTICLSLTRLGYRSLCDNTFFFYILYFAVTYIFYRGISAYNPNQNTN